MEFEMLQYANASTSQSALSFVYKMERFGLAITENKFYKKAWPTNTAVCSQHRMPVCALFLTLPQAF